MIKDTLQYTYEANNKQRLPITMGQCEHGDHPDYKFPVTVECIGGKEPVEDWDPSYENQVHALIYADRSIALTLYECQYFLFTIHNGEMIYRNGMLSKWKIIDSDLDKIAGLK